MRLPIIILAGRRWTVRLALWPVANGGSRPVIGVDLHALP